MTWQPITGGQWYQVSRKRQGSDNQIMVALLTDQETTFIDHIEPSVPSASTVRYSLEAVATNGGQAEVLAAAYDLTPRDIGLITTASNDGILVEWDDVPEADFFLLDRHVQGGGRDRIMVILLPTGTVSYLDQQVESLTDYLYNVYAGLGSVFGNF